MKILKISLIVVTVITLAYFVLNVKQQLNRIETNVEQKNIAEAPLNKQEPSQIIKQQKVDNKETKAVIVDKEKVPVQDKAEQDNVKKVDEPAKEQQEKQDNQRKIEPKPTKQLNNLSNELESWSFKRNDNHQAPIGYTKTKLEQYNSYYIANTQEKVIYLTFDEGYENGYTSRILDTLKAYDVQATFFVTKPYIAQNQELVKRMKIDGHIIANHSVTHKSFPSLTDDQIVNELKETADYYKSITGYDMDKFFRPPMGEYSERVLNITSQEGYKTIFWSIAYKDWDVNNQPGKNYVYQQFVDNHHSGAIALVHAVSSSNTEALPDVITYLKKQGYRFGSLHEIE